MWINRLYAHDIPTRSGKITDNSNFLDSVHIEPSRYASLARQQPEANCYFHECLSSLDPLSPRSCSVCRKSWRSWREESIDRRSSHQHYHHSHFHGTGPHTSRQTKVMGYQRCAASGPSGGHGPRGLRGSRWFSIERCGSGWFGPPDSPASGVGCALPAACIHTFDAL